MQTMGIGISSAKFLLEGVDVVLFQTTTKLLLALYACAKNFILNSWTHPFIFLK